MEERKTRGRGRKGMEMKDERKEGKKRDRGREEKVLSRKGRKE